MPRRPTRTAAPHKKGLPLFTVKGDDDQWDDIVVDLLWRSLYWGDEPDPANPDISGLCPRSCRGECRQKPLSRTQRQRRRRAPRRPVHIADLDDIPGVLQALAKARGSSLSRQTAEFLVQRLEAAFARLET